MKHFILKQLEDFTVCNTYPQVEEGSWTKFETFGVIGPAGHHSHFQQRWSVCIREIKQSGATAQYSWAVPGSTFRFEEKLVQEKYVHNPLIAYFSSRTDCQRGDVWPATGKCLTITVMNTHEHFAKLARVKNIKRHMDGRIWLLSQQKMGQFGLGPQI